MSKAQEKRDQVAANVAWNVKAREDWNKREAIAAAAEELTEAGDAYEVISGSLSPATDREELIHDNAHAAGEAVGRADALINRAEDELAAVDDMIHWITYKFPDTTMTTLEVLETLRDQINAGVKA